MAKRKEKEFFMHSLFHLVPHISIVAMRAGYLWAGSLNKYLFARLFISPSGTLNLIFSTGEIIKDNALE